MEKPINLLVEAIRNRSLPTWTRLEERGATLSDQEKSMLLVEAIRNRSLPTWTRLEERGATLSDEEKNMLLERALLMSQPTESLLNRAEGFSAALQGITQASDFLKLFKSVGQVAKRLLDQGTQFRPEIVRLLLLDKKYSNSNDKVVLAAQQFDLDELIQLLSDYGADETPPAVFHVLASGSSRGTNPVVVIVKLKSGEMRTVPRHLLEHRSGWVKAALHFRERQKCDALPLDMGFFSEACMNFVLDFLITHPTYVDWSLLDNSESMIQELGDAADYYLIPDLLHAIEARPTAGVMSTEEDVEENVSDA